MTHASIRALALAFLLSCLGLAATADAAHAGRGTPPVRVGIVLFDGVQIIDFAAPYEVFGQAGFSVATVSPDGRPVTTAMGLSVSPDHGFDDAPAFDVLLVPGGDIHAAAADEATLAFIRTRSVGAKHVLSVCTGSHILAATGLLDGLTATTFYPAVGQLAADYPKIRVVSDRRWVDSGKIVTSAGLSSGIDAALHVVARLRGEDAARTTALHLEYDWRPDDGFVRGRMADRYLPGLRDVQWPADITFERLVAVGDEDQWRTRYRIASQTPREELLSRIARSIDGDGWRRVADEDRYRWRRDLDGRRLVLTVTTWPGEPDGTFELESRLAIVE